MGGSSPAVSQQPTTNYNSAIMAGLRLGNGITNGAINMPPTLLSANTNELQSTARREALINALTSRQTEQELSPDTAAIRAGLAKNINQDLTGGPSTALSNMWLKSGINDAVATGANVNGSFARSALADTTRDDYYKNRDNQEAKASGFLQSNPLPTMGLDPGALAGNIQQTNEANTGTINNWRSGILNSVSGNANNYMSALQQAIQSQAAINQNNTAAQNAARGSNSSMWGSLAGAGIGAAGAIGGGILVAF